MFSRGLPSFTLTMFALHVVFGCCAHHGHVVAAETSATGVQQEHGETAHGGPHGTASVQRLHVCVCGRHRSETPHPCQGTTCSVWAPPDSKQSNLEKAASETFLPISEMSNPTWLVPRPTGQAPAVLQTGCPMSARPQPWLQSWLT